MNTIELFNNALGITSPWYIEKVEFTTDKEKSDGRGSAKRGTDSGKDSKDEIFHVISGANSDKELHIYINFEKGAEFPHPDLVNGEVVMCKAYDSKIFHWRHLNFFQFPCHIYARVPRVGNSKLSPRRVEVPWARNNSGFTLLFESFVVELAKSMPVSNVADIVGENDTTLWSVIQHYVDKAREKADYSEVNKLGMDETSKKGHNYITVFVNLDTNKVVYVTGGKDQTTVGRFAEDFVAHNGDCGKIGVVTCDMSLGFKAGIKTHFTNSVTIIDKFHVIKHFNEAVDKVRREEVKENSLLKNTRYLWLHNDDTMTEKQLAKKQELMRKHLKTGRACMMREELQEVYNNSANREEAEAGLDKLCSWIMHARIPQMKEVAKMIKNHKDEILNYFDNRYTNAILEGLNNIIQNIKCRARGFRNDKYFSTMIYLVCGEIDLSTVLVWA